jgi:membrane associated rhomboid family serine protease
VGASAGISGVLAYYGVAFPRAQVGVVFWFWYVVRWIRLPAWAFLVAWIALQVLGALEQVGGMTSVSAIGHLGGASVGLLVALSVRARRRRLLKE